MKRLVVAFARKVQPLGMPELVPDEVQISFTAESVCDESETSTISDSQWNSLNIHPHLIILCSAIPRSTTSDGGDSTAMLVYISLSISQNANVLSPTSA